jgi:hypothetical protein
MAKRGDVKVTAPVNIIVLMRRRKRRRKKSVSHCVGSSARLEYKRVAAVSFYSGVHFGILMREQCAGKLPPPEQKLFLSLTPKPPSHQTGKDPSLLLLLLQ